ncbi:MAG: hypothetical protein ACRC7I_15125 [Selenomonadaceae bacterium]
MSEDSLPVNDTIKDDMVKAIITPKPTMPAQSFIYVGPNIPKDGLNRFRVYQGGMPEQYDELFTVCPAIKKLFVDVEKLSETIFLIDKTGSAYHTWYAEALNYVKGV